MVLQKKKNHFYEICVEIRKIIFSYLNIYKFYKKFYFKIIKFYIINTFELTQLIYIKLLNYTKIKITKYI